MRTNAKQPRVADRSIGRTNGGDRNYTHVGWPLFDLSRAPHHVTVCRVPRRAISARAIVIPARQQPSPELVKYGRRHLSLTTCVEVVRIERAEARIRVDDTVVAIVARLRGGM